MKIEKEVVNSFIRLIVTAENFEETKIFREVKEGFITPYNEVALVAKREALQENGA